MQQRRVRFWDCRFPQMNTTTAPFLFHSAYKLNNNKSYFQQPLGTAFGLRMRWEISSQQEKQDESYEEDDEDTEAKPVQ